jgi:hypothetical protein
MNFRVNRCWFGRKIVSKTLSASPGKLDIEVWLFVFLILHIHNPIPVRLRDEVMLSLLWRESNSPSD